MQLEFDTGGDEEYYVLQVHLKGGGCLQYVLPLAAADKIIHAYYGWKQDPDASNPLALITKRFATESGAVDSSCGLIDFAQAAGMCLGVPPPPVPRVLAREEREYYQMACAYLAAKIDSLSEGEEWRQGQSEDDEDPEDENCEYEMHIEFDPDEEEEEDDE